MSRRAAEKRIVIPDHKFKDVVLTKFMNRIMIDGKNLLQKKLFMAHLIFYQKNR